MRSRLATVRTALFLVHLVLAGGCSVSASLQPPVAKAAATRPSPDEWVRTELYFGLSKRDGATVADADWNRFVDEQITPRFPDGFTVISAQGHYLQDGQVAAEASRVVTILHRRAHDVDDRIDALVEDYVQRFGQD